MFSYTWVAKQIGDPDFNRIDIIPLHTPQIKGRDLDNIWRVMGEIAVAEKFNAKRLHKNHLFFDHIRVALRRGQNIVLTGQKRRPTSASPATRSKAARRQARV